MSTTMHTSSDSTEEDGEPDTQIADERLQEGKFHVPESIREESVWIAYRMQESGEKTKKIPTAPEFNRNKEVYNTTPSSLEDAVEFDDAIDFVRESKETLGEDGADGVGLVLTSTDLVGWDLDDCYDASTGKIEQWAYEIVEDLESYAEVSPSGDGIHCIVRAEGGIDLAHQNKAPVGAEVYEDDRYFTFTGRHIEGTPDGVEDRKQASLELHRRLMPERSDVDAEMADELDAEPIHDSAPELTASSSSGIPVGDKFGGSSDDDDLTDEELIEKACESDDEFERLWRGDTSGHGGDHSRADASFASKLAWWTNGNIHQMDRIFRNSGLMRRKFERTLGGTTYGRYTLEKARSWSSR